MQKGRKIASAHAENELVRFEFGRNELSKKLQEIEKQLQASKKLLIDLESKTAKRLRKSEETQAFAGRFAETFGVERSEERFIDFDRNERLPASVMEMKSYGEDLSWVENRSQAHNTH